MPLGHQYLDFLKGLLHGDLGSALINQEPVREIIAQALPASLELSITALALAALVGLSIGFSGIARPEGKLDRQDGFMALAPTPCLLWVAMLLQLLFAVILGWLPVAVASTQSGGTLRQWIPALRQPSQR